MGPPHRPCRPTGPAPDGSGAAGQLGPPPAVIKAINDAAKAGCEICASVIARAAGSTVCSSTATRICSCRSRPRRLSRWRLGLAGRWSARASLQVGLANGQGRLSRQVAHIRKLENRLPEVMGELAWHESALGAPTDVAHFRRRITDLAQQVVDLEAQLDERDQELEAARSADRELMATLNERNWRGRSGLRTDPAATHAPGSLVDFGSGTYPNSTGEGT